MLEGATGTEGCWYTGHREADVGGGQVPRAEAED